MYQKEEHGETEVGDAGEKPLLCVLQLFVTGATPNSLRALSNLKQICEEHLKGRYSLEVIDVYQQRARAEKEQLVALPLLIKKQPLPERRIIGDLADTEKVLKGLELLF